MDCGAIIKYFKRKLGTRRDCKNHASPSYRRARKQNIPPNVRVNSGLLNNKGLSAQIKLNWGASSPSRFKHDRHRAIT